MEEGFYLYLSSDACETLYPSNTKAKFTTQLDQVLELDPSQEWRICLCEIITQADDEGEVKRTEINAGPIFIYLDIIEPSKVGDTSSNLLRIVPPTSSHQSFADRYYISVKRLRIPSISAFLAKKSGDPYPFTSGGDPVILVLSFAPTAGKGI